MIYSIVVYGAPHSSQAPYSAYHFIKSALAMGHSVYRVFFYHDGALNGSSLAVSPQDDNLLPDAWRKLKELHNMDLVICIGAGIKRGVINQQESQRYERQQHSLDDIFELSGLGQLVDATLKSDRVITFGAR
ncbi:sulfurtransferase complex subunit TusD [Hahella ganghwensis]|uniref:sulfurtransferase complex subunit TusD n=1 Tax=Hahella ganghwensis TaxID=286420 RepID=UPI00035EAE18|nr:sulfurtransferase complex subunit TusD [Hahella ganghwensis]